MILRRVGEAAAATALVVVAVVVVVEAGCARLLRGRKLGRGGREAVKGGEGAEDPLSNGETGGGTLEWWTGSMRIYHDVLLYVSSWDSATLTTNHTQFSKQYGQKGKKLISIVLSNVHDFLNTKSIQNTYIELYSISSLSITMCNVDEGQHDACRCHSGRVCGYDGARAIAPHAS